MRPIAYARTTAQAQAGQKVINLDDISPGKNTAGALEDLDAADWLAWEVNEVYTADPIASVSVNAVTMTTNIPTDIPKDAKIWACYELTRATHIRIPVPATSLLDINNAKLQAGYSQHQGGAGLARTGEDDIMIFHSDNITTAASYYYLDGIYVDNTNVVEG